MPSHNALLKWNLFEGKNHCPRCQQLAGQIKTANEWAMTERPGFHRGCGCELVQVDGANERDNAPPETPVSRDIPPQGQFGEGPGHGSKGGGEHGEGPGHGATPPPNPPNQSGTITERPSAPKATPLNPTPPPATPPTTYTGNTSSKR